MKHPTASQTLTAVDRDAGLGMRRVVVGALETNCWILFCTITRRAVILDPGDEPGRVIDAAADLEIGGIVLTHAHWDHVLALPEVADHFDVSVLGHPDDDPVWPHELEHLRDNGHFDAGTATDDLLSRGVRLAPDPSRPYWDGTRQALRDRQSLRVGRLTVQVLHTPGHTPGGVSLVVGRHLFSGDTLFPGGPGLTGWPLSDFPTIMSSVRRLVALPADTSVHPGHGRSTTIGAELPHVEDWSARGW